MNLNTMINLQSGRPYSRQYYVPTAGNPPAVVAPAGSPGYRQDFQYLWDLGIGKTFNLGDDVGLQLNLQFLNLLNSAPIDAWWTEVLAEGDEYVGYLWVKPRRLQLHIGIQF